MSRLTGEQGYTLTEMLVVMAIMGVVMGGVTALFVNGSNAEVELNHRFQAQQAARLSLDRVRREAHCATTITVSGTSAVVGGVTYYPAMTETPTGCGGQYSWCTAAVNGSTTRYRLYRQSGATCSSATGTKYADYLTRGTVFAYAYPSGSLPRLTVDLPVNLVPARAERTYELTDDIVLRNNVRAP